MLTSDSFEVKRVNSGRGFTFFDVMVTRPDGSVFMFERHDTKESANEQVALIKKRLGV